MAEVMTGFDGGDAIGIGDIQEFVAVVQAAFMVHVDREKIRHGLWKEYPAADQCNQIKIKIDRVIRSLEVLRGSPTPLPSDQVELVRQNILEELPDIINYAVFAHRIIEGKI